MRIKLIGAAAAIALIGAPGLADYSAWWSDPPFYGE